MLTILRAGKVWNKIKDVVFRSGGVGGAQQRMTDTEAKIVRQFINKVKAGDKLIIKGQLSPCGHCQRRMKELVAMTGASVEYLCKEGKKQFSWVATRLPNGRVQVVRSQGAKVIRERNLEHPDPTLGLGSELAGLNRYQTGQKNRISRGRRFLARSFGKRFGAATGSRSGLSSLNGVGQRGEDCWQTQLFRQGSLP